MISKNNRLFKHIVLFVFLFTPLMIFAQISLTFHVLDIDTESPIAEARAEYYGQKLITDENGFAKIELSSEQCEKIQISDKKNKYGFYRLDFPIFTKDNYHQSNINSKTIRDTTVIYLVPNAVVYLAPDTIAMGNYGSSEKISKGIEYYYSGEVMQTAGFVVSVALPIVEQGIFYLSNNSNYKAMVGIEIATVGIGVILYCVGTAKKNKGKKMITIGASGINFKF